MTVLLVLFFISIMIGIDALRQYRAKHVNDVSDIFVHEWGITMADGGQKIEDTKKESK